MKELDKTKAYDLRDLNDEQLETIAYKLALHLDVLKVNKKIKYNKHIGYWDYVITVDETLTNALTLFEDKKEEIKFNLQIGDTFEHDGFICEVKEPIKKSIWVYDGFNKTYDKINKEDFESGWHKEITDQDFINQLEKHLK